MIAYLKKNTIAKYKARRSPWRHYLQAIVVVILCTAIAGVMFPYFDAENLSMVYLTGIVISALYFGRGPSILATILSVAAFDILFTHPYGSFAISDLQYVLTLIVMLLVAVTVSSLAVRSKEQTEIAKEREQRTASLYAMNQKFAGAQDLQTLIDIAVEHIAAEFDSQVVVYVPKANDELKISASRQANPSTFDVEIAQWVYKTGQIGGYRTENFPEDPYLYLPLKTLNSMVGLLAIYAPGKAEFKLPERRPFLETFGDQLAVAIERIKLAEEAEKARMQAEAERLRNSLLSSVSHDLRTPLASIMGAASTLLKKGFALDAKTHTELSQVVYEEAERLNRLVGNLLDMTRLESGGLKIEKEWQTLEEVVGATLRYLGKRRSKHHIIVNLPPDLPLIPMDTVLIEQVLINLLENAIKYTPSETDIEISASATKEAVTIKIADQGPGIIPGEAERIFDKFYRRNLRDSGSVGLGLAICKGIMEAHGGRIWVENRLSGGAVFTICLPLEGKQPELNEEI